MTREQRIEFALRRLTVMVNAILGPLDIVPEETTVSIECSDGPHKGEIGRLNLAEVLLEADSALSMPKT